MKNKSWQKFKKNKLAFVGLLYIVLLAIVAIGGPFIRPDYSKFSNNQNLSLSKQKPGFSVEVLRVKKKDWKDPSFFDKLFHYGWDMPYREVPIATYSMQNDSIFVQLFSPYGAYIDDLEVAKFALTDLVSNDNTNLEMSISNWVYVKKFTLGTDRYGRDLLSRLMAGIIMSLSVGVITVLISLLIGIFLGATAGYYGGWLDKLVMWFINVIWSIPTLLLVMAIVFAFGKGFEKVFLAVGLTMWVEVARIVRGQVLSLREKEFVEAGRALGYSNMRIIFKHILPNITSPIIVISAANFAAAILIEAGLSFLGIGAQIPTPTWGNMIKEHYAFITTDLAYLAYLPGLMIMSLVLAFMLVGNGLRDALNVR